MSKTSIAGNDWQRGARQQAWLPLGLAFVCGWAAGACGPAQGDAGATSEVAPGDISASGEEGAVGCGSSEAAEAPGSILEVVGQVNALPRPVTLPCFLATLPRPLEVHASQSIFSAQPAAGRRSPRMFIFSGALTLTIVP